MGLTSGKISEDPIGFAGGDVNLARYVGNLPTGATHPSGPRTEQIYMEGGVPAPLTSENDTDVFWFMQSMQPATGGNTWSKGDLLDWSAAYFAGMGDALTVECTLYIRETLGINGGVDTASGIYVAGNLTGTAINVYLTGGAGLARTPAVARLMVRAYTATDIAVARVQWAIGS